MRNSLADNGFQVRHRSCILGRERCGSQRIAESNIDCWETVLFPRAACSEE